MLRPVLLLSLALALSGYCQTYDSPSFQPVSGIPATAHVHGYERGNTDPPTAFDVVSIRQSKPEQRSGGYGFSPDGFTATNMSLKRLVMFAFRIRSDKLITGLPTWADSVRFDVRAKVDADKASALHSLPPAEARNDRFMMLQRMLNDRFHFRSHDVTSQVPAYALVLDKGPTKLKETDAVVPGTPRKPETQDNAGDGYISLHDSPIGLLARQLSDLVDREVVDQTGLTGTYDISLKWTPAASFDRQPDSTPADQPSNPQADFGSIFTAIREQLGLRLVPTHPTTVSIMVVDELKMPTEN